ncbi:MAG: MFS transporter [Caldimonas sp.]
MSPRWRSLAALTLARAAMGFQFQSIAAVAPLLGGGLGLDNSQLGWLIGLYLLPGVAFSLPGGLLGRRFGDKRVVLAGLVLMGIGGLSLALADSFAQANAARFMSGIGAVMLNVVVTKMVTDLFDGKERLLAMSVLVNSWPIGIGIALLMLGPLSELLGWRGGLVLAAVFAAIGFAVVSVVCRPPAPAPAAAEGVPLPLAPVGIGLATLTRHEWRLLLIGSLPWWLYNAAFQIVMSFLPSFFVGTGIGIARAGSLVALNSVLFVVGVQAGGLLLKRASRPDLICHLAVAGWCVSLVFIAAGSAPLPWLLVGGVLGGIPAAALMSLPGEFLRPESRSAGMGVFFTVYYLGCAILPPLAGALYDASGGQAALAMAAGVAFAGTAALALFRRAMARPRG